MDTLNLPAYEFTTHVQNGKRFIYDGLRRRYVRLTPEEWVRQHFVQYLIHEQGTPAGLIAIEHGFTYQGMARRADIVVHNRRGQPLLMTECKAPDIAITQDAFDQIAGYNEVVEARFLVVTNGLEHYACAIDRAAHTYRFLDTLPPYDELAQAAR